MAECKRIGVAATATLAVTLLACAIGQTAKNEAVWLEHSEKESAKGALLKVRSGAGVAVADWKSQVDWAYVRASSGHANLSIEDLDSPTPEVAEIPLLDEGVHRIGVDLRPTTILVSLAEVPQDALTKPHSPDAKVRATLWRSASLILRGKGSGEPSPVATAKTGQAAEIRPLMDPTALAPGSDLPLRIYAQGASLPGVVVSCITPDGLRLATGRTDSSGITHVRLSRSGVWRLEFFAVLPSPSAGELPRAYSGTLSFRVPEWTGGGGG